MTHWQCLDRCGACCYLEPLERPDLEEYLSPEELLRYLSMVGEDGWCIHFDQGSRRCRIYADRPGFCRVEPQTFEQMYGVGPEDLDEFAIACCLDQIDSVYGDRSIELLRYQRAIAAANSAGSANSANSSEAESDRHSS